MTESKLKHKKIALREADDIKFIPYTMAPELEKDRNLNPLGFQVVNYRSDPEA